MPDITKLSDEQLASIAGVSLQDVPDEKLYNIAGISNNKNEQKTDSSNIEKVGVLGQVFLEPSVAGTRELIRKGGIVGKIAGAIPAGLGSNLLASTGALGEDKQRLVNQAFLTPSASETFQNEALRKVHSDIADSASKRTGLLAPNKPLGKLLLSYDIATRGQLASATGMVQDMWTNPVDWLFSIGDIASGIKTLKTPIKGLTSKVSNIANKYRKAVGATTRGIGKKADILNDNKNIIVGLESAVDHMIDTGKVVNSTEDALNVVNDTKKSILDEFTKLRKTASETGIAVDGRNVAQRVFESQASRASNLANPELQVKAFKRASDISHEGSIPLDVVEETIRKLNAQRPATLGSSIDDVTNAQLNETIAKAYRAELDSAILEATGKEYQPLKTAYGTLIRLEDDLAKKVLQLGKQSNTSLVRQLSESIDNVPLIYGILSGNIPLAGAAILQKGAKVGLKRIGSVDNQIRSLFKTISDLKTKPNIAPKLTTIQTGRRIVPQKNKEQ